MQELILVLCWLGVVQSTLLGLYFLSVSKEQFNYFFLGLMLLMVALRVTKSTIYMFNPDPSLWIMNIGFAAHAMLGPLFLLYIITLLSKIKAPSFYLAHFVPAAIILVLSAYLQLETFWYMGGYSILLYYTLIYLVIGWYLFIRNYQKEKLGKVIIFLLATLTIFQVSYFSNYILRLTPYETGAIVHSLLIYAISFLVLKDNNIFTLNKKKKYSNLNLTSTDTERYKQKMILIMESHKPYLDTEFSLAKFAELSSIPSHILSFVLSESLKQNFLHFTNNYRIEEAKLALLNPKKQHLSIAGIASDCGFKTLSSFNTSFKKFVGSTPSDYRKKMISPETLK